MESRDPNLSNFVTQIAFWLISRTKMFITKTQKDGGKFDVESTPEAPWSTARISHPQMKGFSVPKSKGLSAPKTVIKSGLSQ